MRERPIPPVVDGEPVEAAPRVDDHRTALWDAAIRAAFRAYTSVNMHLPPGTRLREESAAILGLLGKCPP